MSETKTKTFSTAYYFVCRNGSVIYGPVGFVADPWRVNATTAVASRNGVTLSGDTECTFDALGNCTFDNLIMNGISTNSILSFDVSYGEQLNLFGRRLRRVATAPNFYPKTDKKIK